MSDVADVTLEDALFDIEEGFWLKGKEHFLANVDRKCLLAFPQAGQMHGVFRREQIADTAAVPNRWRDLRISNRHLLQPTDDAAIISYRADVVRADGEAYTALVGSTYVRRGEGWKLAAHQHSPVIEN